jgi:hypothetical protein
MARSEARIAVTIWDDQEFRVLSPGAQWLYMFLVSQSDISHVGLLALRPRRWSTKAAGLSPELLYAYLGELSAARFVVVDEDAEEVLVRSFIRRDGVYRQPNLLRAAEKQLTTVTSATLRVALAIEVRRVLLAEDIPAGSKAVAERMLTLLPNPSPNPSPEGIEHPLGDRGVVTAATTRVPLAPSPLPLAPEPAPAAPRAREPIDPADDEYANVTPVERIVIEATGARPSEARALVERVRRGRDNIRSLPALLRRMATDGDLAEQLVEVRGSAVRTEVSQAMAAARAGPECVHGEPGGANPHPRSGEPLCPKCRVAARVLNLNPRPVREATG